MPSIDLRRFAWRDPLEIAAPHAETPFATLLMSDGGPSGRWSYFVAEPSKTLTVEASDPGASLDALRGLLGPRAPVAEGGPPFQGGVIGLLPYEFGAPLLPLDLARDPDWPDAVLARYEAVLAFDHASREVVAIGRGATAADARAERNRAQAWLDAPALGELSEAPAESFEATAPGESYAAAVHDIVERIGAGELYQANIGRSWRGRLRAGSKPFDSFRRLMRLSPGPFAAYMRLPHRAVVSHSPERFLRIAGDGRTVETRPIKGTRPRGADPEADARLAEQLKLSAKDRAENLMIVDLMRNDLARVCEAGSVQVEALWTVESYAQVHHLVSTVTGRLARGQDAASLLEATFPPGSITGAPKLQAMKRIAALEPPRGIWCGSLFWAGFDGALDSSVLIRTAAMVEGADRRWSVRAAAGAGIVADSDPAAELAETQSKIAGLKLALTGKP